MGASCSKRFLSYVLSGRRGAEGQSGSSENQGNLEGIPRRLGILGVPLSFKARRLSIDKEDKCDGKVPDLLDVCIAHFAKSLQHFDQRTLDFIPNDLIQRIFEELVQQQRLDSNTISLFEGRNIDRAFLASQPGVTDDWLRSLCSPELRILQISHCRQ